MIAAIPRLLLLAVAASLAGCAGDPFTTDPLNRPGTWAPTDDNAANLRAMVADPGDLVRGKGAPGALGAEANPPVKLLYSGRRAPLSSESTTDVGAGAAGSAGGAAGGSNGGQP